MPTAAAYSHTTPAIPAVSVREIVAGEPSQWTGRLKNDFEASVFPAYPAIAALKERVMELGPVYAAMSGSGASVFGLFRSDILSPSVRDEFTDCDTLFAKL